MRFACVYNKEKEKLIAKENTVMNLLNMRNMTIRLEFDYCCVISKTTLKMDAT